MIVRPDRKYPKMKSNKDDDEIGGRSYTNATPTIEKTMAGTTADTSMRHRGVDTSTASENSTDDSSNENKDTGTVNSSEKAQHEGPNISSLTTNDLSKRDGAEFTSTSLRRLSNADLSKHSSHSQMHAVASYESLEDNFRNHSNLGAAAASESDIQQRARSASLPPPTVTIVHQTLNTRPPSPYSESMRKGGGLRRGKWTMEEEAYVARVIQDFNSGYLNAPAGTTLRTYLSEKLQCDPMRITKKFTGDACIGKRVFHPAVRSPANNTAIDKAQAELEALESRWLKRLEAQQRESDKKAAASAAAAAAATDHRIVSWSGLHADALEPEIPYQHQSTLAKTASWLDRAKTVLKEQQNEALASAQSTDSAPHSEIVREMQEVQRLIREGPHIQRTSVDIPSIVESGVEDRPPSPASSTEPEPADKRLRTGAEDAEALVGFLRSVRASAASGQDF